MYTFKFLNKNVFLVREEKIAIMREKHTALMKPIVFALEHVRSITAAPAETPHEKWFQDNYGDAIENALEKLKTPSNPAKPGSSWIPFKEVENNPKHATEMAHHSSHEIRNLNKWTPYLECKRFYKSVEGSLWPVAYKQYRNKCFCLRIWKSVGKGGWMAKVPNLSCMEGSHQ